jgi:N-acetylglucosamine-6-phosphate deacetylase
MTTTILNCRVVSPGVDRPDATISIDAGIIAGIGNSDAVRPRSGEKVSAARPEAEGGDRVFDARGGIALPGFVDIHCHGADGFDVTDGTVEAIDAIAAAKLAEGVTTFCPTTLTLPPDRLVETMRAVAEYGKRESFARLGGVHLEGPFINPACAGAQNVDHVRRPDIEEVLGLHSISPVAIVSFAPEMDDGNTFLRGLLREGIVPSCGHSAATSAEFGRAYAAGLRNLTHFCNQMSGLHHRDIGLVGRGLLHDDVFIEMICDGVHLTPEMIALLFRIKPVDAIVLITDAIRAAGLGDGEFELGGIAVRVVDGVARLPGSENLAGSTLRFNRALAKAHSVTGLPLSELVRTTSLNQARFLGLGEIGRIEEGCHADIVVVDDDFEIEAVFVGGERRV